MSPYDDHDPRRAAVSQRRRAQVGADVQRLERGLSRDADSATISYRRTDGLVAVIVGYGHSLAARVDDADRLLPPGVWVRECVSTPTSIYSDLRGRDPEEARDRAVYPKYERRVVVREDVAAQKGKGSR